MTILKLTFLSIFDNELTEIFKVKDKAKSEKIQLLFRVSVVTIYSILFNSENSDKGNSTKKVF